jgi:hypothetical protein
MDQISGRSPVIAANAAYSRKAIAVKRNVTETDIKAEEKTRPTLGRLLVASAKNHKGRLVKHGSRIIALEINETLH